MPQVRGGKALAQSSGDEDGEEVFKQNQGHSLSTDWVWTGSWGRSHLTT